MSQRTDVPGLLYGQDQLIVDWVAERIDFAPAVAFGPCAAIGVVKNNRILAGVVYHDLQKDFETIQLSMAADSPLWARRSVIAGLLSYPFKQLNIYKAWIATPLTSDHALRTFYKIGFKREAVLAHHFGRKKHCVMARMLSPEFDRLYGGPNG